MVFLDWPKALQDVAATRRLAIICTIVATASLVGEHFTPTEALEGLRILGKLSDFSLWPLLGLGLSIGPHTERVARNRDALREIERTLPTTSDDTLRD